MSKATLTALALAIGLVDAAPQDSTDVLATLAKHGAALRSVECDVDLYIPPGPWYLPALGNGWIPGHVQCAFDSHLTCDLANLSSETAFVSVVVRTHDHYLKILRSEPMTVAAHSTDSAEAPLLHHLSLLLLEANLMPHRALAGIFTCERSDNRITLKKRMPGPITGIAYVFDAAHERIESIRLEAGTEKMEARGIEFHDVSGVSMPSRVSISTGHRNSIHATFRNFVGNGPSPLPSWVNDPCLPEIPLPPLKRLKDPVQLAVAKSMVTPTPDIARLLEQARHARPESEIVNEMLAFWYLRDNKAEAFLKELEQNGRLTPILALLRGRRGASRLGKMLQAADNAIAAKDVESFRAAVQEEGLPLLDYLYPAPSTQKQGRVFAKRDAAFIEHLSADRSPAVTLLLARHAAHTGDMEHAVERYVALLNTEWSGLLRPEMSWVANAARAKAAPLLERLVQIEPNPLLCSMLAVIRFDENDKEAAIRQVRLAISSVKDKPAGFLADLEEAKEFEAVATRLLEIEDKPLFSAYVAGMTVAIGHVDESREETVRTACGEDPEKLFDLLKRLPHMDLYLLQRFGITPERAVEMARRRIVNAVAGAEEYRLLAKFVAREPKSQEGLAEVLLTGTQRHSLDAEIWVGWADASYVAGDFASAVKGYRAALDALRSAGSGDRSLQETLQRLAVQFLFSEPRPEDGEQFKTEDPIIVKLAQAFVRVANSKERKEIVETYLKETGDALGAARAFEVLGDADRSIEVHRRILASRASDPTLRACTTLALVRLLEQKQRFGEGFVVCDLVLEYGADDESGPAAKQRSLFENRRARFAAKIGEDHFVKEFLASTFEPVPAEKEQQAHALIEKLASSDSTERERASKKLREMGPAITPAIRDSLASDDPEVTSRVRTMIAEWALEFAKKRFLQVGS